MIEDDLQWLVGSESDCSIWYDKWLDGEALIVRIDMPDELVYTRDYKLSKFMHEGHWNIPAIFSDALPQIANQMQQLAILDGDELVWKEASNGKMTVKGAYSFYREEGPIQTEWCRKIWCPFIPPKVSVFLWRCITKTLHVGENFKRRRLKSCSVCLDCITGELETMEHLLRDCKAAADIWRWVSCALGEDMLRFGSVSEMIQYMVMASMNNTLNQLKLTVTAVALWIIWKRRNHMRFNAKGESAIVACGKVRAFVRRLSFLFSGCANRSLGEERCLSFFASPIIHRRGIRWREILWFKPPPVWFKANTDGASRGQPGPASCAGLFRMYRGFSMGSFASPLGVATSMLSEMMGVVHAIEIADRNSWFPLWIETSSSMVVRKVVSDSDDIPWQIKRRWRNCMRILKRNTFRISHIHREGNKPADALANLGYGLDGFTWWSSLPMEAMVFYERNLNGVGEIRICN